MKTGTLYVVATPLGNLEDLAPRALSVLREATTVACEDTRRTRGLLERFGVEQRRLISYHKFNERAKMESFLAELRSGRDVALVTDGGTPGVSDPGALLVAAALAEGLTVSPIPGPSAVAAAISVCGFPSGSFLLEGFLPARAAARRKQLRSLAQETRPIVFFEAPHRLAAALADMLEALGDRPVTVVREATKLYEEVRRITLKELLLRAGEDEPRGEFTLVVQGRPEGRAPDSRSDIPIEQLRMRYHVILGEGVDPREAVKRLARETGWPRREVYSVVRAGGPKKPARSK